MTTRHAPMRNAPNFRSLAGLQAAAGRVVRGGSLYRSGAFSELDEADMELFAAHGIRTVIDLRREKEREREPNRFAADHRPRVITLDLAASFDGDVEAEYWEAMREGEGDAGARRAMRTVYEAMPAALVPWLSQVFCVLAAEEHLPAVVHCAVGKDRTGVVCALLLSALGVSRASIMADYLASEGRYPAQRSVFYQKRIRDKLGVTDTKALCDAVTGVQPEYLDAAFASIDRRWGSMENYLHAAGISAALRSRLSSTLLASRPAAGAVTERLERAWPSEPPRR